MLIKLGTKAEIDAGLGEIALPTTKAAALLGLTTGRLRQLIKAQVILPAATMDGTYLFLKKDVEGLKAIRES